MPPNIVRFVSDDTSEKMLGYGGGDVLTPHIDAIGRNGVIFDSFHCPSTVCMASRYAALTGHYCGRCPTESFRRNYPSNAPYSVAFNTHVLPGVESTIGHVLQNAGYRTGYVGKWHTGPGESELGVNWFEPYDDPRDPETADKLLEHQQRVCEQVRATGFDYAGGISWGNPQPGDRQIRELEVHNLEWMTDSALEFIDESAKRDGPFFLNYAVTPIHGNGHIESLMSDPRITPEGYREEHLGCMPPRPTIYERIIDAGLPFDYITAGALWMDDAIGMVVKRLRELGVEENTIIIYSSDHGPCEDKGTVYQGGVRIPCVLQWKEKVPANRHVTAMAQNIDWLPTLAEAAGADLPDDMVTDGKSLMPVLTGERADLPGREDMYFEHGYSRGLRTKRWKYISWRLPDEIIDQMKSGQQDRACNHSGSFRDIATCLTVERHPDFFQPDQLYDLVADPEEEHNLADDPAYADVLEAMQDRLRTYLESFDNPFPLDDVPDYMTSEEFHELARPYSSRDGMDELLWWTRKWHHRPEDVV